MNPSIRLFWVGGKYDGTGLFTNSLQRKMIRRICKVYWPQVTKKDECDEVMEPASDEVGRRRLKMLGHVARRRTPASRILEKAPTAARKRGRPPATIVRSSRATGCGCRRCGKRSRRCQNPSIDIFVIILMIIYQ